MKQELNHTPGPWRIGDAGATVFGPKTDSPAPKTVAKVSRAPIVSDTDRANVCLIAAAPDLLNCLAAYVTIEREAAPHSASPLCTRAMAAIRKARGEA